VAGSFPPPTDCTLWGELGDLNGDGRLDLATGQGECSSSDEIYLGNSTMPVDDRAPTIYRVETLGVVPVGVSPPLRFAVRDSHNTDQGPRLARVYAEIDPSGTPTEIDAFAMGGELFRVMLPPANAEITFRVCAIDPSGNSACSPTQTYGEDPPPPVDGDVESDASADASTDGAIPQDAMPAPDASSLTPDASGPAPDAGHDEPKESGCSCESTGGANPMGGLLILCVVFLVLARRRL
jgi:hypothetical protein